MWAAGDPPDAVDLETEDLTPLAGGRPRERAPPRRVEGVDRDGTGEVPDERDRDGAERPRRAADVEVGACLHHGAGRGHQEHRLLVVDVPGDPLGRIRALGTGATGGARRTGRASGT